MLSDGEILIGVFAVAKGLNSLIIDSSPPRSPMANVKFFQLSAVGYAHPGPRYMDAR